MEQKNVIKFCQFCGNRIPESAKYCPFCGGCIDRKVAEIDDAMENHTKITTIDIKPVSVESEHVNDSNDSSEVGQQNDNRCELAETSTLSPSDEKSNNKKGNRILLMVLAIVLVFFSCYRLYLKTEVHKKANEVVEMMGGVDGVREYLNRSDNSVIYNKDKHQQLYDYVEETNLNIESENNYVASFGDINRPQKQLVFKGKDYNHEMIELISEGEQVYFHQINQNLSYYVEVFRDNEKGHKVYSGDDYIKKNLTDFIRTNNFTCYNVTPIKAVGWNSIGEIFYNPAHNFIWRLTDARDNNSVSWNRIQTGKGNQPSVIANDSLYFIVSVERNDTEYELDSVYDAYDDFVELSKSIIMDTVSKNSVTLKSNITYKRSLLNNYDTIEGNVSIILKSDQGDTNMRLTQVILYEKSFLYSITVMYDTAKYSKGIIDDYLRGFCVI